MIAARVVTVFIWVVLVALAPARASLEQESLDLQTEALLAGRTTAEIAQAHRATVELRQARAACDAELRASSAIPVSCYRTLELEKRAGLLPAETAKSARSTLNGACRSRAGRAANLDALESVVNAANLSAECSAAIRARLEELMYMVADRNPADVFKRRLGAVRREN